MPAAAIQSAQSQHQLDALLEKRRLAKDVCAKACDERRSDFPNLMSSFKLDADQHDIATDFSTSWTKK